MQKQRNEPIRREIFVRFRLIFFSAFAFLLVFIIMMSVQSAGLRRAESAVAGELEKVHAANARTAELERHLAFTQTYEYVAQEARSRFGYMEQDERRYSMEDGTVQPAAYPFPMDGI
ncbi:MAG: hypothetical protein FWG37_04800 [Clostridia bacterium]|nr:hypothetical protein [Clostridia bacterium]